MTERKDQLNLPFGAAEGTHAERRSLIGMALTKARADLGVSYFVQWVFDVTKGGIDGELKRSYEQIADAPWGLCCSVRSARRIVQRAVDAGLVCRIENRYRCGSQQANSYSIDWLGVRRMLNLSIESVEALVVGVEGLTGGQIDHGHGQIDQGHGQNDHHIKDNNLLKYPLKYPDPAPGAGAGSAADAESNDDDWIRSNFPDAVILESRPVSALDPGDCRASVFDPLHLKMLKTVELVVWFRRQLGAIEPVLNANELDLALAIACGMAAGSKRDIQNPVGWFVKTVSHRRWKRARSWIDSAVRLVDRSDVRRELGA